MQMKKYSTALLLFIGIVYTAPTQHDFTNATSFTSMEVTLMSQPITETVYNQLVNLVSMCSVSYCLTKGDLKKGKFPQLCPLVFCSAERETTVVKTFEPAVNEIGAAGYIAINHSQQKIYVTFRGSQTDIDWLTDFEFSPRTYVPYVSLSKEFQAPWQCDNCLVHKGFYKSVGFFMQNAFPTVMELLSSYPNYKLVITGHSLGGALLALTGLEFQLLGLQPLVVTYAQPKFALTFTFTDKVNEIFDRNSNLKLLEETGSLETGYFRVVHNGDQITYLPPTFLHAGIEFYISKKPLPHERKDVQLKTSPDDSDPDVESRSKLQKGLKEAMLKEHSEYFIKVSGCKNR